MAERNRTYTVGEGLALGNVCRQKIAFSVVRYSRTTHFKQGSSFYLDKTLLSHYDKKQEKWVLCRVQSYDSSGVLVSFFMSIMSYKYNLLSSECLIINEA